MIDITSILTALITLVSAVITGLLIPYIRGKTTAAQREQIAAWTKIAVAAAEQIYAGSGRGDEKKAYVKALLAKLGVTYDEAAVDAMIEAAVYELPSQITASSQ